MKHAHRTCSNCVGQKFSFVQLVVPKLLHGVYRVVDFCVLHVVIRQRSLLVRFFDKTRTPLTTWFEAAWHLTTAKNGMSAKTLQKTLGTNYRVAWTLLQRYRVAMVRVDRKPLSGNVEVDETFVGGVEHGAKRGRGAHKCIVVIAVEIKQPKGFGRIRMRHVPDASANSLVPSYWKLLSQDQLLSPMVGVVTMSCQLMGTYELNWYCLIAVTPRT